jgi:hypothetical protein
MRNKIISIFLLPVLILSSLAAQAQKESLEDLVPFKKGNKWGIVHHDGKPFYPATLDSIMGYTVPEKDSASKIRYDYLDKCTEGGRFPVLFIATKDGRQDIVTKSDKAVVPFQYDEFENAGRFTILLKNKEFGFADHFNNHQEKNPYIIQSFIPIIWYTVKMDCSTFSSS